MGVGDAQGIAMGFAVVSRLRVSRVDGDCVRDAISFLGAQSRAELLSVSTRWCWPLQAALPADDRPQAIDGADNELRIA